MKHVITTLTLIAAASTLYAQDTVNKQKQSQRQTVTVTNVNRNVNRNQSNAQIIDNSVYQAPFDMFGYVAWKKYQDERKAWSRTKRGAPLSPLDSQATQPIAVAVPSDPSKARYDAFLRSKGINPNTIGHATVINGKMVVPSVEEQYAVRNANYAAQLANANSTTTETVASK